MEAETPNEYTYLKIPPIAEMRSCAGLVLAGMAARAKVGVGGLDEAVEVLESLHGNDEPTVYRFFLQDDRVVAEIEDRSDVVDGEPGWRTVVELVS